MHLATCFGPVNSAQYAQTEQLAFRPMDWVMFTFLVIPPAVWAASMQGVTSATTDQEIDDALDMSRIVYKKITERLRDQVAKLRAGEITEED